MPTGIVEDLKSGAGVLCYRFNGIEHSDELGLDMTFFRTYDPAIGRWLQIDPLAEKYYSMSPYTGMGNNPISISDMLGDSLNVSGLAGNNSAATQLNNSLESTTGLSLSTDENGNVTYESEDGRAQISRDSNGKKTGSKKARKTLMKLIDSEKRVDVKDNTGKGNKVISGKTSSMNTFLFDPEQIGELQAAMSSDLNSATLGAGLTFFHELTHTEYGGDNKDPGSSTWSVEAGDPAKTVNKIRKQLGADYGQRATYGTTKVDGARYMPMSKAALKSLKKGKVPKSKFLKF